MEGRTAVCPNAKHEDHPPPITALTENTMSSDTLSNRPLEIRNCSNALKTGGTILYPTDTLWGIGCDATNDSAVNKINDIKKRPQANSLITLVSGGWMLERYVHEIPPIAWELIDHSESPLTIIYPNARGLAANVVAGDGSAAIRLVKDEFCEMLINRFRKPVVSTSANVSGEPAPLAFTHISASIISQVDHVVNLRQEETQGGKPSSIIKLGLNGEVVIVRK